MTNADALPMWHIYKSPSDYPGMFVVRRIVVTAGTLTNDPEPLAIVSSLEKAREAIPEGLFRMPRQEDDDPVIVEVWL